LSLKYLDLWKAIKVSHNTGAGWIAKNRLPPVDVCLCIARNLGVSVEYLVTGTETALPDDSYVFEKPDTEELSEGSQRKGRCLPQSLPDDLLGALSYCTEDQMKRIRKTLGLPPDP